MKFRVEIARKAAREIEKLYEWLAEHSQVVAERWRRRSLMQSLHWKRTRSVVARRQSRSTTKGSASFFMANAAGCTASYIEIRGALLRVACSVCPVVVSKPQQRQNERGHHDVCARMQGTYVSKQGMVPPKRCSHEDNYSRRGSQTTPGQVANRRYSGNEQEHCQHDHATRRAPYGHFIGNNVGPGLGPRAPKLNTTDCQGGTYQDNQCTSHNSANRCCAHRHSSAHPIFAASSTLFFFAMVGATVSVSHRPPADVPPTTAAAWYCTLRGPWG